MGFFKRNSVDNAARQDAFVDPFPVRCCAPKVYENSFHSTFWYYVSGLVFAVISVITIFLWVRDTLASGPFGWSWVLLLPALGLMFLSFEAMPDNEEARQRNLIAKYGASVDQIIPEIRDGVIVRHVITGLKKRALLTIDRSTSEPFLSPLENTQK